MDVAKYTLIGFLLGIGALLLMRALAPRLGLIDVPDVRKTHGEPVPVVGGVSIFLALCVSVLFMSEMPHGFDWLLLAGALLIAIGLLDDRYQLRASLRMLGQIFVALIMVFGAGLVIRTIGDPFFVGEIGTGAFAMPLTVLVTVTVINALNMTDGMDGLAGSFSVVSLVPMLLLLLVAGRWAEAGFLGALIGALFAFLVFNFPLALNRKVRTFMGDAGSTFLGLVIVWVGISISQGEERLISPVAGLWFIATPVHDLIASAIRRARKGKAFWIPDLGHAHHIFLKAGFTARQALWVMMFVALCHGLIGLSGPFLGVPDGVLFTLWVVAGLLHIWVVQKAWVFSKIFEIIRTDL
jgi:UDP-GlcNAc:undecaprenyl-phosphate GlcNAc-1-phosphate transferase